MDSDFSRLSYRGTAAERAAFTPPRDGAEFYETDTNARYFYEGAWILLPNGPLCGITAEGGYFVIVTAGENLSRGEVVQITQGAGGADGKVYKNAVNGDMPVGVVYADALANAPAKIVTTGIVHVLPNAADTAVRGYVLTSSSTTAGRVDQAAAAPAIAVHVREVGHWLDTGSGAGVITRAVVHWN